MKVKIENITQLAILISDHILHDPNGTFTQIVKALLERDEPITRIELNIRIITEAEECESQLKKPLKI